MDWQRAQHGAAQATGSGGRREDVMAANREVELKLAVPRGALKDIGQVAQAAGATHDTSPQPLRSVYFDTRKHRLHQRGYVLRIRNNGGPGNIQTVKTLKSADGGLTRGEWETGVQGKKPRPDPLGNSPLAEVLDDPADWRKLRPLFTVEVERDTYLLHRDGATIELALDDGVVRNEHEEQSIVEAELELKAGEPGALFAFAREISAAVPTMVSLTSKAERGYRLLAGETSRPTVSLDFALHRKMTTAEAVRAVGFTCLAALFDNLAILVREGTPDAVHQSRVCVRRLRALVSLFKPALDWPDGRTIRADLKWLCDLLGDVRELDVFIKSVLEPSAAANPDVPGFKPLLATLHERRDHTYDLAVDELRSPRMSGLSLALVAHLEGLLAHGPPGNSAQRERDKPVRRFAAKELRRRLRSLLKDSAALDQMPPEERHKIRIRAKKLRYMAEPFQGIVGWKRFSDVVSSLHEIQDTLGELNDYKVNRDMALDYAKKALDPGSADSSAALAAGVAAAGGSEDTATALNNAIAARRRLARVPALRPG